MGGRGREEREHFMTHLCKGRGVRKSITWGSGEERNSGNSVAKGGGRRAGAGTYVPVGESRAGHCDQHGRKCDRYSSSCD